MRGLEGKQTWTCDQGGDAAYELDRDCVTSDGIVMGALKGRFRGDGRLLDFIWVDNVL